MPGIALNSALDAPTVKDSASGWRGGHYARSGRCRSRILLAVPPASPSRSGQIWGDEIPSWSLVRYIGIMSPGSSGGYRAM